MLFCFSACVNYFIINYRGAQGTGASSRLWGAEKSSQRMIDLSWLLKKRGLLGTEDR